MPDAKFLKEGSAGGSACGGNAFDEIAVRVDEGKSFATLQILERHGFEQGRSFDACLSDDIDVGETVFVLDPKTC